MRDGIGEEMMELKPISKMFTESLLINYNMSLDELNKLILQSSSELYEDKFFKMFAVLNEKVCVGTISLFEHSSSIVSIGPDIFKEYRQRGYATEAMKAAMDIARVKGYKIVCQQIRTNNSASINLHAKLGFETDNYVFRNRNNNEIVLYIKSLI